MYLSYLKLTCNATFFGYATGGLRPVLWISELLGLSETRCSFIPVNHVPEGFDVVWAAVLEFQVVSVFPYVQAHNRET